MSSLENVENALVLLCVSLKHATFSLCFVTFCYAFFFRFFWKLLKRFFIFFYFFEFVLKLFNII